MKYGILKHFHLGKMFRRDSNLVFQLFCLLLDHLFEAEDRGLLVVEGDAPRVGRRHELTRILDRHRLVRELHLVAGSAEISALAPDLERQQQKLVLK